MIVFNLACKDCGLEFEGWFDSSKEFEKQRKKGHIFCPSCNSIATNKSLMAPNLSKKSNSKKIEKKKKTMANNIKKYKKIIEKNFDYVGDNFTYEARSIHYDRKKKSKGIYGSASKKDLKELKEEGIESQVIPWIDDNEN